ncbi:MAG: DMT family transporter [Candidatus Gracilibacteria bacterium]|nr:DMT family transporter [Candidatus Gracilibacteria bacterium]
MSLLFWGLALLSTIGYNLQWALNTKFGRKGDSLSMGTYRSLSLAISMLPLLLFSSTKNILIIYNYQFELILSSISAGIGVWFMYISMKSLPIGITTSFRSVFSVLTTIVGGFLLFGESLSLITIIFVLVILIGGVIISLSKVKFNHLINDNFYVGIILASISGILSAIALTLMVKVSRELDPFVSSYFWEFEIGIVLLIILLIRNKVYKGKIEKISKKDFLNIFTASSPSLIGTGCYAFASTIGPIGIVSSIGVLGIAFSTIFGIFLFKEKLSFKQYFGIFIIIIGILGLKLYK